MFFFRISKSHRLLDRISETYCPPTRHTYTKSTITDSSHNDSSSWKFSQGWLFEILKIIISIKSKISADLPILEFSGAVNILAVFQKTAVWCVFVAHAIELGVVLVSKLEWFSPMITARMIFGRSKIGKLSRTVTVNLIFAIWWPLSRLGQPKKFYKRLKFLKKMITLLLCNFLPSLLIAYHM